MKNNKLDAGIGGAHIRIARATDHLTQIIEFYRDGLGFEVVDSFADHDGFDGVMLGHPGSRYHLEFTRHRDNKAGKLSSQENLLVFYLPKTDEWERAVERMQANGYEPVESYNPYWDIKGKTFEDADGYRIVLQHAAWP